MTFPRIFARFDYWREFPPTHLLVAKIAVYLGAHKPEVRHTAESDAAFDAELRSMMGAEGKLRL